MEPWTVRQLTLASHPTILVFGFGSDMFGVQDVATKVIEKLKAQHVVDHSGFKVLGALSAKSLSPRFRPSIYHHHVQYKNNMGPILNQTKDIEQNMQDIQWFIKTHPESQHIVEIDGSQFLTTYVPFNATVIIHTSRCCRLLSQVAVDALFLVPPMSSIEDEQYLKITHHIDALPFMKQLHTKEAQVGVVIQGQHYHWDMK